MIPTIEGKPPRGRQFHTCTSISNNRIVTFGGSDDFRCFNDVHCLRCDQKAQNWEWIQPEVKGKLPVPRTGHTAVVVADRYIIISGGYNPFFGAEAAADESSSTHFYEDAYVLDTLTWIWRELLLEPSAHRRQSVRPAGTLEVMKYAADDLDGLVWCSAIIIDGSLLPREESDTGNESSSSSSPSAHDSTETILFYGGLTSAGQKSKNICVRTIGTAGLESTDSNVPRQSPGQIATRFLSSPTPS